MTRRHTLGVAMTVMALVGVACGGGDNRPASGASTATSVAGSCQGIPGLPESVADHGRKQATGSELSVEAGDSFFSPTCFDVRADKVTLVVRNTGSALHNVSIPEQGIDADVAGSQAITVAVNLGTTPVPYFCKYHRTSGMFGALLPSGA